MVCVQATGLPHPMCVLTRAHATSTQIHPEREGLRHLVKRVQYRQTEVDKERTGGKREDR
jgi:hypothetical protein